MNKYLRLIKKTNKKAKKLTMEDKPVINMNGVKMKGAVLGGKVDGPAGGPTTMEPTKEEA